MIGAWCVVWISGVVMSHVGDRDFVGAEAGWRIHLYDLTRSVSGKLRCVNAIVCARRRRVFVDLKEVLYRFFIEAIVLAVKLFDVWIVVERFSQIANELMPPDVIYRLHLGSVFIDLPRKEVVKRVAVKH